MEKERPRDDHAGHSGHDGHGDHAAVFRRRFWLSLVLTAPVVAYSHMLMQLTGWAPQSFPGSHVVGPVFGTAVFLYGGRFFLGDGWAEVRSRRPGMMPLVSMGIIVAFGGSLATSLGLLDVDLRPEHSTLVTIMLLGHWLEMRALGQARKPSQPWRRCSRTRRSASAVQASWRRFPCRSWPPATSCWSVPEAGCRPMGRSSRVRLSSTSP